MSNILISLLSEQTIPNLLLIKELPLIDRYLLISTKKMEKRKVSHWIMEASGLSQNQFQIISVIEDSLSDIENQLHCLEFDDEDSLFVNLTGGTKIMSIGVYSFFMKKGGKIFYIPIGKNVYRQIFPEIKNRENTIHYRLGVKEYLTSYGIEIRSTNLNHLVKPPAFTASFFQTYLTYSQENKFQEVIKELRQHRNKNRHPIDDAEQIFLEKIQFPEPSQGDQQRPFLTKKEIRYLTGDWLEEFVYSMVQNYLELDKRYIAVGIQIEKNKVRNELDVLFMYENTLHVIECKTELVDSGINLINDSLYKSAALRKDFGLSAGSYIFTLTNIGEEKSDIRKSHQERSDVLGIKIIDGAMLQDVGRMQSFFNGIKNTKKDSG